MPFYLLKLEEKYIVDQIEEDILRPGERINRNIEEKENEQKRKIFDSDSFNAWNNVNRVLNDSSCKCEHTNTRCIRIG
ncbi:MAG: hypothetical protein EAX96_06355 [Candidatus Lokiarchaeota archaeon]|nr:hypothetical protein [Candidatus Lokiarchaeota archaeon]